MLRCFSSINENHERTCILRSMDRIRTAWIFCIIPIFISWDLTLYFLPEFSSNHWSSLSHLWMLTLWIQSRSKVADVFFFIDDLITFYRLLISILLYCISYGKIFVKNCQLSIENIAFYPSNLTQNEESNNWSKITYFTWYSHFCWIRLFCLGPDSMFYFLEETFLLYVFRLGEDLSDFLQRFY